MIFFFLYVLEAHDRLKRSIIFFTVYRRIYQKRFIGGIMVICFLNYLSEKERSCMFYYAYVNTKRCKTSLL